METEYDAGIKNNYEIEIKYTNKKSDIKLIIFQPKNTIEPKRCYYRFTWL